MSDSFQPSHVPCLSDASRAEEVEPCRYQWGAIMTPTPRPRTGGQKKCNFGSQSNMLVENYSLADRFEVFLPLRLFSCGWFFEECCKSEIIIPQIPETAASGQPVATWCRP